MKLKFNKINECDVLFTKEVNFKLNFRKIKFDTFNSNYFYLRYVPEIIFNFFFNNKDKLNIKLIYKKIIINKFKPKVILDAFLTGHTKKIRMLFPKIKIVTYSEFVVLPNLFKDELKIISESIKHCNYFLMFSKSIHETSVLKKLKVYDKKKILAVGSLKINEITLKKKKKEYDIMYISQYMFGSKKNSQSLLKKMNIIEFKTIKLIDEYCRKKNKKYCIALRSSRSTKNSKNNILEELNFMGKINPSINCSLENPISLANKSKLIISNHSTLALELDALGKKVFFLTLFSKEKKIIEKEFFINFIKKKKNFDFGLNKEKLFNKINLCFSRNKKLSINNKKNSFIIYDKKNKILGKLLQKLLNEKKN